ncbi:FAD-dependent oxidoreductase [Megalodesulfovibrio paquesii]
MAKKKRIRFPAKPSRYEFDVAIIGGGVSGLAAAAQLSRVAELEVVVLEKEVEPGGAPQHIDNYSFGWREYKRPMQGPTYAKKMLAGAKRTEILGGVQALSIERDGADHAVIQVVGPQGSFAVKARRVLLATGAWESSQFSRRLAGSRPLGIMTSGALLRHMALTRVLPFSRPVMLGSEWVSLASIVTMHKAGMEPPILVDEWPAPAAPAMVLKGLCKKYGMTFQADTRVERIIGRNKVEAVVLEHQGKRTLQVCDGVLLTGRFKPEAPYLAGGFLEVDAGSRGPATDQFHRVYEGDMPTPVFACGNLLGLAKSSWVCSKQGETAATLLARDIAGELEAAPGVPVHISPPLKYVWPQRHVFEQGEQSPKFYVDFHKPCSGVLALRSDGRKVADRFLPQAIPGKLEVLEPPPAMLPVLRAGSRLTVTLEHPDDGPF